MVQHVTQLGMRGDLLVPMVDRIGVDIVRDEMRRFDEIMNVIPGDRRHVAVQAGGHVGIVPKALAKKFHLVYTFEPVPLNFVCLCHNAPETNIIRAQACLGMHRQPPVMINGWGDNTAYGYVDGGGPFPVLALDNMMLPMLDLLWLDIEGYEGKALAGAVETIARTRPAAIVLELQGHSTRYGFSDVEIEKVMKDQHGYAKRALTDRDAIFLPID